LIQFGGHIEEGDRRGTVGSLHTDERVDFEVGIVEIDICGVESNEEIHQSVLAVRRNSREKAGLELGSVWEIAIHWDCDLGCFGVDITNIHSALVGEEDHIALSYGVDTHIVFAAR
jgi:hypothetical protein